MARSPVLLILVLLVSTAMRAAMRPVYHGATDEPAASCFWGIAAPFGDDLKGDCDAFLALQARSIVREGFAATGGVPLFNVDKSEPAKFAPYDHHPPGVALVTALAFKLFGSSECVARSVALFFSAATLLLLALFVRREAGEPAAIMMAVGLSTAPIGLYWSTQLDYFVPTIAGCVLFLLAALKETPTRRDRVVAGVALALAVSFDFLALLAPIALSLERLCARPRGWKALLGWPCFAAAVAVAHKTWMAMHAPHEESAATAALGDRVLLLLVRVFEELRSEWSLPAGVDVPRYLTAVARHVFDLTGPVGAILLAFGVVLAFSPAGSRPVKRLLRAGLWLALGAGLLPRLRAWDHEYFQLYWLIPLATALALVFAFVFGKAAASGGEVTPSTPSHPRRLIAAALGIATAFTGWLTQPRSEAASDHPSSHRLGRELGAAVPAKVRAIALPAGAHANDFVPAWYAGRAVLKLPAGNETRAGAAGWLNLLGLNDAEVWLAKDPQWPGRGGFQPLK